jgi:hypothetical protein
VCHEVQWWRVSGTCTGICIGCGVALESDDTQAFDPSISSVERILDDTSHTTHHIETLGGKGENTLCGLFC